MSIRCRWLARAPRAATTVLSIRKRLAACAVMLGLALPILAIAQPAPPTISIDDMAAYESDFHETRFSLHLSQPASGYVTVYVTMVDGTAVGAWEPTGDFIKFNTAVNFPEGTTDAELTVPFVDDTTDEPNETFTLHLSDAVGATILDGEAVGTILNDDGPRLILANVSVTEGNSGSKFATFTVRLSQAKDSPVTYDIATANGSATAGSDYLASALTGQVIPAGQTTKSFTVQVFGDTSIETDETFTVYLANVTGATISRGIATGTVVTDDGVTLSVLDTTVTEGPRDTRLANFTVKLSKPAAGPVVFDIATQGGTATSVEDFASGSASGVTIPAGQTTATFSVAVKGDGESEANEAFTVRLSNVTGVDSLGDDTATGTIYNDDGATVSLRDGAVAEGSGGPGTPTWVMSAQLNNPYAGEYKLVLATGVVAGTATAGSDFIAGTQEITLTPGSSGQVLVPINADADVEFDETFFVDLIEAHGATIYDARAKVTLVNDDGPTVTINDVALAEGNNGTRLATFTVSLSEVSTSPVMYDIATMDGHALSGSDFVASSLMGQVIPPGTRTRTFPVTVLGDTSIEANEEFLVQVSSMTGGVFGRSLGTATIRNDDGPTVSIGDASVSEGNSGTKLLTFPVTMSMASPDTVNLSATPFTGAGGTASPYSDFNPPKSDYLSIPPGQTSTSYSLVVNSDMAVEANEVVYVDLYVANGATVFDYRGVGTILNDDGPTLAVNNVALAEGDSGNPLATFTVSLSQAATVPVTYSISTAPSSAVAGSDYLTTSLTGQTIPAGQLSKSFAVPLVGDTVVEPNELFYVNLGTASGASILDKQGDATVLNDDGPTLSVANASVSEGSSGTKLVNVVVSLSKPAAGPVTYSIATGTGTAQAGSDFVAASLAGETIPAGMLSRTFAVTINGDAVAEPNEAFFVTASAVTGATAFDPVAYVVITNDD